jgi:hypothetical protein
MEVTKTGASDLGSGNTWTVSYAGSEGNPRGLWKTRLRGLRASDLTPIIIARFHAKYEKTTDGCWLWKGAKERSGYGLAYTGFKADGRKDRHFAHRVAYALSKGDIRAGLEVMHGCDTPGCVNPDHLTLGTHQQNIADRDAKGRTKKTSPKIRKITVEGVREIRESNQPASYFARKWGVHESHIKHIRAGRRRKVA